MTLDERKTLTKVSTRKPLTNIPQTKAHTSERENQEIVCKTRKLVKGPDTARTSKKLFAAGVVGELREIWLIRSNFPGFSVDGQRSETSELNMD